MSHSSKILFIGSHYPPELLPLLRKMAKTPMANANDAFQKRLLEGMLAAGANVDSITLPSIGSYPYRSRLLKSPRLEKKEQSGTESISFYNFTGLKFLSRFKSLYSYLEKYAAHQNGPLSIVIYDIHLPFIYSAVFTKFRRRDTKIVLIVPDLIEFSYPGKSKLVYLFLRFQRFLYFVAERAIDAFVLFTGNMTVPLKVEGRPHIVIEGICPDDLKNSAIPEIVDGVHDSKIILYTGSLDERNNIVNLISAFQNMSSQDAKLIICGRGSDEARVRLICQKDSRIIYMGEIDNIEVRALQERATLLVNPRLPGDLYTLYSFPSKILEYLSSGTPCIMYNLAGIPEEYFYYINCPDDYSTDALASKMDEILQCSDDRFILRAQHARQFVHLHKNSSRQGKRLVDFIEDL